MKEKLLLDILNIKTKHLHFTTVLMRGSFGNQISYQPRYSLSDDPQNRTFPLGSDFYPPFLMFFSGQSDVPLTSPNTIPEVTFLPLFYHNTKM